MRHFRTSSYTIFITDFVMFQIVPNIKRPISKVRRVTLNDIAQFLFRYLNEDTRTTARPPAKPHDIVSCRCDKCREFRLSCREKKTRKEYEQVKSNRQQSLRDALVDRLHNKKVD